MDTLVADALTETLNSFATYIYVFASNFTAGFIAETQSGYIKDLDLNEAVGGSPWYTYAQQI